jgi:C_GCAxxG_C_C family probable redox protein
MSARIDHIKALRDPSEPHGYNCAQVLMMGFHDVLGVSEAQAAKMSVFYGGGMRHGTVCGAVSAALMILGAAGASDLDAGRFLQEFRSRHESTQCAALLTKSHAQGIPKKVHCDGLIFEVAEALEKELKL